MRTPLSQTLTEEFLREHYSNRGKSTDQIGKEVGCSGGRVRHFLRKYGIGLSDQMRQKMQMSLMQAGQQTRFKQGDPSPQKGHTKESHAGVARSATAKVGKKRPNLTGPRHPNWKDGAGSEARRLRNGSDYKRWREAVYIRDDYTCQKCSRRGGRLNAHHKESFADHPDLRLDVNNGVTLCLKCHWEMHPENLTLKGKAKSEEHRRKLSAAQRRRYARERQERAAVLIQPES